MASLKAFPDFNSSLDGDELVVKQLLPPRLRGRHAQRARRAGHPGRRPEGPAGDRRRADRAVGQGARGQARAGGDGGRDVHDLLARRHRRHVVHADRQRARGGDPRRRALGDEAGVGRHGVRAAADAAVVAVLRPPRHRRRRRRALRRAPVRRARPTCGGCCCERRSTSWSRTSGTSPTCPSSRSSSRSATRSPPRIRWSCWSPTRRRWRSRRRRPARSRS